MKKTYKPQSKQTKLTNTYRKKTIDPGVDLNIKKDKDDLENIDEFWNMAEYVMDDATETEESIQLPKSVKDVVNKQVLAENLESSVIEDVMNIPTDGSKDTSTNMEDISQNPLFDIEVMQENTSSKSRINDLPLNTSGLTCETVIPKVEAKLKNPKAKMADKKGKQTDNKTKPKTDDKTKLKTENKTQNTEINLDKKTKQNKKSKEIEKLIKDKKEIKNKSKLKEEIVIEVSQTKKRSKTENNKKETKMKFGESSIVKEDFVYKGKKLRGNDDMVRGMTDLRTLFHGRSILEPVITKKSLESGVLFLKPDASIMNETADVSFTILVLKGFVKIFLNGESFDLKRESCFYVDEGDNYNLVDCSQNGSTMFITFKSK